MSFTWRTTGKPLSPPHTQKLTFRVLESLSSHSHSIQTSSIFFYYVISPQMKFFTLSGNRLLDIWSKIFLQPGVYIFPLKVVCLTSFPPNLLPTSQHLIHCKLSLHSLPQAGSIFLQQKYFLIHESISVCSFYYRGFFFFSAFLLFCTVWFC